MKKVLLYFPVQLQNPSSGVAKKCLGIIDAFKQKYDVDVFSEEEGLIFFNRQLIKDFSTTKNRLRYYHYNSAFFFGEFDSIKNICKEKKYDIVYIRLHWFVSIGMLNFIIRLKRYNPNAIITIEIPTYPYNKEIVGRFNKARYFLTWVLVPFLKKYVNSIVTFSQHKTIWNIPTITISNGYYNPALQHTQINEDYASKTFINNVLHIGMIAQFSPWHAPDILINSLKKYFEDKPTSNDIILHFIGSGNDLKPCIELVNKLGLNNNVFFYGRQNTGEIIKILNGVHVCIGTLGYHRKGVKLGSCLKNREYAFLGKPIILKTKDLDFPESLYFVKYFPDNDSLLDMESIKKFYEKIRIEHPEFRHEIIEYAQKNLTWIKKMEKVFQTYCFI